MRKMLTHLGRDESGQGALAMVLLLLMLGAVILTPLLVSMSTGVKSGEVYESKMQEFYAAEAGVEDAIWKIKDRNLSASYSLGEEINDRNVTVTIEDNGGGIYLITSTATSDDGGSTIVESYVSLPMDFSNLLDNAIVSGNEVDVAEDPNVSGNISLPLDGTLSPATFEPDNGMVKWEELDWPTAEELSLFYADDVEGHDYRYDNIDVKRYSSIGPLYWDGSFSVYNTGGPGVLQLNGTVYVTGDLIFKQPGNNNKYTIDLNGQTIYCEGNIVIAPQHITLNGSGCIIAVGDVTLMPGLESSPDDFVLVMSLNETVNLKPHGNFYGCLAGDDKVYIQKSDLTWTDPSTYDLNFPMDDGDGGTGGGRTVRSLLANKVTKLPRPFCYLITQNDELCSFLAAFKHQVANSISRWLRRSTVTLHFTY